MTTLREAAQQALEALGSSLYPQPRQMAAIAALRAALENEFNPDWDQVGALQESLREHMAEIHRLRTALAEPEGGGNLPPPLQLPAEVAATITTTDIAWLATRRLTKLWQELGQMRWVGADEGWDRAIEAVRSRLNDECQAVLDWKAKADQSQATAVQLLRKMQGVNDD